MKKRAPIFILSIFLSIILNLSKAYAEKFDINNIPKNLKFCDDEETWPPFILYSIPENGEKKLRGYSIDVAESFFQKNNIRFDIEMLPWKRCLELTMQGKYDLILNAMLTEKRQKDYFASDVFYSLTPIYFWSSKKDFSNIKSPNDLENYKICGIFGYDYSSFKVDLKKIDQGSKNIDSLKLKLISGRCDIAIGHKETLSEQVNTNIVSILKNPLIKYNVIPGLDKINFAILVTKNKPYSKDLLNYINVELKDFKKLEIHQKLKEFWGL